MAVSEKSVKMFEQATEIQEAHKIEAWDYYWAKYCDEPFKLWVVSGYCTDSGVYGLGIDEGEQEDYILIAWLPRQDQLQDMIETIKNKLHMIFRFHDFLKDGRYGKSHHCPFVVLANIFDNEILMEVFWLAFVMYEKFDKVWSETEETWVLTSKKSSSL